MPQVARRAEDGRNDGQHLRIVRPGLHIPIRVASHLNERRQCLASLTDHTLKTELAPLVETSMVRQSTGAPASLVQRFRVFEQASLLVQRLVLDLNNGDQEKTIATIHRLLLTTQPEPLLPNLEYLRMIISQPDHLNSASAFLQGQLGELIIHCNQNANSDPQGWSFVFGLFFRTLRSTWHAGVHHPTKLHLIRLPKLELVPDLIQPIPGLCSFKGDLTTLTPAFMSALASSPKLQKIILYEQHPFYSDGLSDEFISGCFRDCHFSALKTLAVVCDQRIVAAILPRIGALLKYLTIRSPNTVLPNALLPDNAAWFRSLISVEIVLVEDMVLSELYDAQPAPLLWRTFSSLLRCPHITTFSFRYDSLRTFAFTDDDLSTIARSWPEAESLKFNWSKQQYRGQLVGGLKDEEGLTMLALPLLAYRCPNLKHLELSSFSAAGRIPPLPNVRPSPHAFTLNVGRANARDVTATAVLLTLLWPSIKVVFDPTSRHVLVWQSICDRLALLRCSAVVSRHPVLLQQEAGNDVLQTINDLAATL